MRTYEEAEKLEQSDTEITLGMRSILGIFFGLALICGVFFGFGYSLGRGNTGPKADLDRATPQAAETAHSATVKTVVEEPDSSGDDQYTDGSNDVRPTRKTAVAVLQPKPSAAAPLTPVAAVAVPQGIAPANPAQVAKTDSSVLAPAKVTGATGLDQTSATPPAAIMVQIAAVSHREDADVLVSALNKLGYSASVRSATADSLLHVQMGPFASRDEAKAMRTKLLNDGYNAILK